MRKYRRDLAGQSLLQGGQNIVSAGKVLVLRRHAAPDSGNRAGRESLRHLIGHDGILGRMTKLLQTASSMLNAAAGTESASRHIGRPQVISMTPSLTRAAIEWILGGLWATAGKSARSSRSTPGCWPPRTSRSSPGRRRSPSCSRCASTTGRAARFTPDRPTERYAPGAGNRRPPTHAAARLRRFSL